MKLLSVKRKKRYNSTEKSGVAVQRKNRIPTLNNTMSSCACHSQPESEVILSMCICIDTLSLMFHAAAFAKASKNAAPRKMVDLQNRLDTLITAPATQRCAEMRGHSPDHRSVERLFAIKGSAGSKQ